ncbi:glycosyltransferase family 2 protein [Hymenobacter sp. BT186]|uniref:Glycosyltransferase family 2 protein n=1 Tax=Hymenobacter telluris TaxID=2816474 RepID=A0A939ETI8_9BACT|nr:glycosyltransferase family 2 protein [Hymenobacter telluris]MBO0357509.1 glycosyltransferase family 2 protein [Hymenobacter telluris]MBW3373535.1 glycosyltransferase family 2 protein [Hymenobacter norwichensis]
MNNLLDLTIAIPVRNEAANLPGCLAAIGSDLASRVIIIDSGSTDATIAIAREAGIEVVNFIWNGHFPKKRNWFLRNYTPSTKWVLFLDADEYLTDSFKQELRTALQDNSSSNVGYWLSYTVYFLGKQLKGGYPLRKLALFRVGAGEYERIDEQQWSQLDMEVHEHPILNGEIGVLHSKIDHQDFRGVSHYVSKHNEYAAWEAARFLKTNTTNSDFTWKQRLKYKLMQTIWIGPLYFLGSFLVLGGFRDGSRGLSFAILKMSYFTQIYCKIRESKSGR